MPNKQKILILLIFAFWVQVYTNAQSKYEWLTIPDSIKTEAGIIRYIDGRINNQSMPDNQLFNTISDELVKATLRNDRFAQIIANFLLGKLYFLDNNYTASVKYYQQALNIIDQKKYPVLTSVFYSRMARAYEKMYEYDTALVNYNKSLVIRKSSKDTVGVVNVLNFIGRLYKKTGDYDLAFDYFTKSLDYIPKDRKTEMEAFTDVNLGLIFLETGDYNYAEKYLMDALNIRKALNKENFIAHTYFRLAELFYKKKAYDIAIKYILKTISIYDKLEIKKSLPGAYNFLGLCYLSQKDYQKAMSLLNNAKKMAEIINNKEYIAQNLLYFGMLYNALKKYDETISVLRSSIDLSSKIHFKSTETKAYKELSTALFNTEKYKEAYLAKEKYNQLNNEIFNTDFAKKVADFTSKEKLEKQSIIYKFQQKEQELKQVAKIRREVLVRNIFIAVSLIFIIFVLILYLQIRQKAKMNKDLKASKGLIEEKQKQILNQRDTLVKQKKELTETLNNVMILKKAIEQSSSTVVITDINGNIEYVNPKFEETTGYTFEEAKGKNPRILKSGNRPKEFYKKLWKTIMSGNVWRGEFENKKKNGAIYIEYAAISSVRDENGQIKHFIAVKDDITKQQKILLELEKLTAVQTKIFSIIGHDLRSPLGSVKSILEFLLKKEYVGENEELSKILGMIYQSIISLSFLSENLLNWGANWLKDNDPKFKDFSINDLINENISLLQNTAKGKEIALNSKLSEALIAYADSEMISIVIRNLIANAIKFTSQGGSITITGEKISEEKIEISVIDTGVGIKKEVIPLLLDEYDLYTTPGTKSEKGSGLGLSICVQFIKRNGGKLEIESKEGKGSTFKFTLPSKSKMKTLGSEEASIKELS